ncbi:hypothetical protein BpHYR1_012342 [Brachionus plicatilis]|uniref:Uncharacterized protein n=1 Tax=Brachionus plicatilis TaxID=10195 RepID=A0A3M7PVC1_BRAPC|nr:hypothetical protein BpHYR1_012342 [Brachionus plicatilis]
MFIKPDRKFMGIKDIMIKQSFQLIIMPITIENPTLETAWQIMLSMSVVRPLQKGTLEASWVARMLDLCSSKS